MYAVGLTGGIGSGKSTVADLFAERGVPVIDTDVISRQLTGPDGPALDDIRAAFGEAVLREDGTLDRAVLRRLVFDDATARQKLEAILHPRIRVEVQRALACMAGPYVLVVVPLLVESGGYRDLLDRILVVDCPETEQISRVMARSGLAREEVAAILAAQANRAERLAVADDVIVNTSSRENLREQVSTLHQRFLVLAAHASA